MEFVKPPDIPTANILLIGPPKTGKSIGAATLPGQLLFLNADLPNATREVHKRNPGGRVLEPEMPVFVKGGKGVIELMSEIARDVMGGSKVLDGVIVDPIGELYRRLLEEQADRATRPDFRIYGDVGVHIERFCRALCEAPINVVIVCHDFAVKDDSLGEMVRMPWTGTKSGSEVLGQKLLGMVDIVGYTGVVYDDEIDETRYVAQLVNAKGRPGGDRFNLLGPVRNLALDEWMEDIAAGHRVDREAKPKEDQPKAKGS